MNQRLVNRYDVLLLWQGEEDEICFNRKSTLERCDRGVQTSEMKARASLCPHRVHGA